MSGAGLKIRHILCQYSLLNPFPLNPCAGTRLRSQLSNWATLGFDAFAAPAPPSLRYYVLSAEVVQHLLGLLAAWWLLSAMGQLLKVTGPLLGRWLEQRVANGNIIW